MVSDMHIAKRVTDHEANSNDHFNMYLTHIAKRVTDYEVNSNDHFNMHLTAGT